MGRHQKRIAAPRSWRIERKTAYWTVKPRPGPHPGERSLPLLLIVRDILKLADSSREARRVLNEGNVVVNGRERRDHKFPVGIFDILSVPAVKADYLVLLDKKGRLRLVETEATEEREASKKLCRVNGKRVLREGRTQLNLHDGRNILLGEEAVEGEGTKIKTHDSLLISVPENQILQHFAYKEGSKVMVVGGKHSAQTGEIAEIRKVRSPEPNVVKIKLLNDRGNGGGKKEGGESFEFETIEDYVFVVGEEKVEVAAVEVAAEVAGVK